MTSSTLHQGDSRKVLRRLIDSGIRFHSIVTDPPYGLVSVQKRFGKAGSAAARTEGNDGSFARLSGGFMGKSWDGTKIERDPEFWKLCHDVLLPGGFCFAFSGARTGHWQAVAMEQAGFIMHPMHGWLYGSGFPKAHDAARAVEKLDGDPAEWEGWAYGTQSQKPALEPIYLAQRPYSEKTGAANLLAHGVGAVNIDDCRVPTGDDTLDGKYVQPDGRYPANLLHDDSPDVRALFPDSDGSGPARKLKRGKRDSDSGWGMQDKEGELRKAGSGSAARFFNSFPPDIPVAFYHAKAGKADRAGSKHPTVKPIGLLRHLVRHITPPGGTVLDPFAGTGTTAVAAMAEGFNCVLIEQDDDYATFIRRRLGLPEDDFSDVI